LDKHYIKYKYKMVMILWLDTSLKYKYMALYSFFNCDNKLKYYNSISKSVSSNYTYTFLDT